MGEFHILRLKASDKGTLTSKNEWRYGKKFESF